jgi:hypothetical protein
MKDHPKKPIQPIASTDLPLKEIWLEILFTERDLDPCGRFSHAAEQLIADEQLRARVIMAMKEFRSRCLIQEGKPAYRMARRDELPASYLEQVRKCLPGLKGSLSLATRRQLVPHQPWLNDEQLNAAFHQYWIVMRGQLNPRLEHLQPSTLFGAPRYDLIEQFWTPARHVASGMLIHEPMISDLAEILAVAGGSAAFGDRQAAEHAVNYLVYAAKTPPLFVRRPDVTNLVLVCAD